MRFTDIVSMNKWLKLQNHEPEYNLPLRTFSIPGVCAAALRKVEGGHCLLDSMVTNPYASSRTRDKALDSMFEFVINYAKLQGYKSIIGYTRIQSMHMRAIAHGFATLDVKVLTKEL